MDLKARIAARKAALAAGTGAVEAITAEQANSATVIDVPSRTISPLEAMGLDAPVSAPEKQAVAQIADPVQAEPAPTPVQKPMTFAERMALKKKQAEEASGTSQPAPTTAVASIQAPKEIPTIKLSDEQLEVLKETEDSELAQAYSDVALAINRLGYTDDGEPLGDAMNELKKALKKNLSASMLLLDSDIGKMVVALRRYTGVELAESAKEKKASSAGGSRTKRTTAITLTAEDIQKALATDF